MSQLVPTPEAFSDSIAKDVVRILETADEVTDPDALRQALKVLATAVPDLLVSTQPAPVVLATTLAALTGSWP